MVQRKLDPWGRYKVTLATCLRCSLQKRLETFIVSIRAYLILTIQSPVICEFYNSHWNPPSEIFLLWSFCFLRNILKCIYGSEFIFNIRNEKYEWKILQKYAPKYLSYLFKYFLFHLFINGVRWLNDIDNINLERKLILD